MRKLKHAEIPRPSPQELTEIRRHPVTVVLDNIRSIYNVGSIFRTSDAALIERLVLTGITGTPQHDDLHKTALGAQDTVPWVYVEDPMKAVIDLKQTGYRIAALEITDEPTPVNALAASDFPMALVVGHEVFGVRNEILGVADLAIEIPQFGAKQSMNVAVAYGIAVFGIIERYRSISGLPRSQFQYDPATP